MKISLEKARYLSKIVGFSGSFKEFMMGLHVEMEHSRTVHGDMITVAKIVKNHLDEKSNYYTDGLRKKFFSKKELGL